ncbi:hypothetical protein ACH4ON_33000 [Streptomyces eurythermus]
MAVIQLVHEYPPTAAPYRRVGHDPGFLSGSGPARNAGSVA